MRLLPADPLRRSAVLLALLSLSGPYFVYTHLFAPTVERGEAKRVRVARLEESNRQASAHEVAGERELEAAVGRYGEHIATLEGLIPAGGEVAVLLEAVSDYETRTGVEVTRMRPQPIEPGEFYDRWSYELDIRGSYHAIGSFLAGIASLARIVVPAAVAIMPEGGSGPAAEDDGGAVLAGLRIESYSLIGTEANRPAAQRSRGGGLVYEREVFAYPSRTRRNPFQPLPLSVEEGPDIEELTLLGIIRHRNPRASVLLMGTGIPSGLDGAGTSETVPLVAYRLRLGDVIGGARVVEIHDRRAVLETEGPEGMQRRVLHVPLAGEGRGS